MWKRVILRVTTGLFRSCEEATRLVSESMDRPLSHRERLQLRGHMLLCQVCERWRIQVAFLRRALRLYPNRLLEDDPETPLLSEKVRHRIQEMLRLQGS